MADYVRGRKAENLYQEPNIIRHLGNSVAALGLVRIPVTAQVWRYDAKARCEIRRGEAPASGAVCKSV
jgi:hypothetical protein